MYDIHDRLHQFLSYSLNVKKNRSKTVHDIKTSVEGVHNFRPLQSFLDFNTETIEDWIANRHAYANWSAKTIRTRLVYLSLFADWLVRKGDIEKNPVKEISRPKLPQKLPRALSEEVCERITSFTKSIPFRYKFERARAIAIIGMFRGTGMRYSEVLNLNIYDVDMSQMEIRVNGGKGEKDRVIPFNDSLRRYLKKYLIERSRLKKTCPAFFASRERNERMGPKQIYKLCWRIRDESGIQFTPHCFRHTYATMLLEKPEFSIYDVKELLGHSSIKTTEIYLSVSNKHLREKIQREGLEV